MANISTSGVVGFKGIPYAKPPVGDLRWRSPQPPEPWQQPLNTSAFSNVCYIWYNGIYGTPLPQSEDCLYLHVWSGAKDMKNERRPVMVWVHGGGFETDYGANARYDGTYLAERDVVVATFEYRMGKTSGS